jgi:hypothetical protein
MTDAELIAELQQRKALIVHCSRTGKGDEAIGGLFYPDDLKHAISSQAVLDTFANATGYNEWNVAHADTIGVFVHPSDPWDVARPMKLSDVPGFDPAMGDGAMVGAVSVTLPEMMAAFPGLPLYSLSGGEIVKVEPGDHDVHFHAVGPAELYI